MLHTRPARIASAEKMAGASREQAGSGRDPEIGGGQAAFIMWHLKADTVRVVSVES